ncbi:fatty acid desaturase family protein [Ferrigenium sp. UT5]|uniref:fatty acid desaturase family protein n=1 Tax=Ferrigenium sp. UT5 TaxID=3242105 RepID=UPI0038B27E2B
MTNPSEFPFTEARALVRDLMTPTPWIYWADFLFHILLAWGAVAVTLRVPAFSVGQIAAYLIAALAFYRAVIFIHELAHLKKGTFRVFRVVWNLTCGIPLLTPSFTYDGVHNDHHKRDVYGTGNDGEYVPFALQPPFGMIVYVLLSLVLPLLVVARFLLLTPLSWVSPPVRRWVWARASSLTIDLNYVRSPKAIRNDHRWVLQEFGAFVFAVVLLAGVALDILGYQVLVLWYAIMALIFSINALRTLAAHAYRNPPDHRLTVGEQFLDSVNVPGNLFLTALWAPVGLRYHATHHLFPKMPYHNLGKAHRRLVRDLSASAVYLQTVRASLRDALWRIWREAAIHQG